VRTRSEIENQLLEKDEEFKKFSEEHRLLDEEAYRLGNMSYLIPADAKRLREIKQRKLILKDILERKIQDILRLESDAQE
jgi:uncharacterized protein YdcH (DUF465 family)